MTAVDSARHTPPRTQKAGKGIRTLDIQLGKLTLYQLSYARGACECIALNCVSAESFAGSAMCMRTLFVITQMASPSERECAPRAMGLSMRRARMMGARRVEFSCRNFPTSRGESPSLRRR